MIQKEIKIVNQMTFLLTFSPVPVFQGVDNVFSVTEVSKVSAEFFLKWLKFYLYSIYNDVPNYN